MNFLDLIKENVLLGDGATGTFLQSRGLEPGGCPELMNVEKEEAVLEMADNYFKAGSDFVLTNTFGGSPFMLKKYLNIKRLKTKILVCMIFRYLFLKLIVNLNYLQICLCHPNCH